MDRRDGIPEAGMKDGERGEADFPGTEESIDKLCNDLEKAEATIRELVEACRQALLTGFHGSDSHSIDKAVDMLHSAIEKATKEGRG